MWKVQTITAEIAVSVLAVAVSYLLGSISTGPWLGLRLRGVDVHAHGGKNIGVTVPTRMLSNLTVRLIPKHYSPIIHADGMPEHPTERMHLTGQAPSTARKRL